MAEIKPEYFNDNQYKQYEWSTECVEFNIREDHFEMMQLFNEGMLSHIHIKCPKRNIDFIFTEYFHDETLDFKASGVIMSRQINMYGVHRADIYETVKKMLSFLF